MFYLNPFANSPLYLLPTDTEISVLQCTSSSNIDLLNGQFPARFSAGLFFTNNFRIKWLVYLRAPRLLFLEHRTKDRILSIAFRTERIDSYEGILE